MSGYKPNQAKGQVLKWEGLAAVAGDYDTILCDIWGVVHNGVAASEQAVDALVRYRESTGGHVVLITNAPRPAPSVRAQLDSMGVAADAYDGILTSGDMTQQVLQDESLGHYCYHLGPDRDKGLFAEGKTEKVGLSEAQFILCTGLEDDETETPADYLSLLEIAKGRGLKMVCANPDLLVERDGKDIPCAGAVCALYEKLGGEVIYFGKPHAPIYRRAQEMFSGLKGGTAVGRTLAIGDGLLTDIKGARGQGLDSLLVLGGIIRDISDDVGVQGLCVAQGIYPHAWTGHLRW